MKTLNKSMKEMYTLLSEGDIFSSEIESEGFCKNEDITFLGFGSCMWSIKGTAHKGHPCVGCKGMLKYRNSKGEEYKDCFSVNGQTLILKLIKSINDDWINKKDWNI